MAQLLVNTTNDIWTTTFTTAAKSITIAGNNNFPLDINSLASVYDTTATAPISLAALQFTWFRANGLPIYQWFFSLLPAGAAGGDTLNLLLNIPQNQAELVQLQKSGTGSAGTPGTFVGAETPTGTVNGVNKVFTLAFAPNGGMALLLTPSGGSATLQNQGSVNSQEPYAYSLSGLTITYVVAPPTGASHIVSYFH